MLSLHNAKEEYMQSVFDSRSLLIPAAIGLTALPISPALSESDLFIAYPPDNHQTLSETIFFIGSASNDKDVYINDKLVERSKFGHFAPIFPLKIGQNQFLIRSEDKTIQLTINRRDAVKSAPKNLGLVTDSLRPARDLSVLPSENICFKAIATPGAEVSVQIAGRSIPLFPQQKPITLPPNNAILTENNDPITIINSGEYEGCATFEQPKGSLGKPRFVAHLAGKQVVQAAKGNIQILDPDQLDTIEVIAEAGVARTGPGTDYSRLTPLPQGTRATTIGRDGDWLKLDYGGWIRESETRSFSGNAATGSIIRSINYRKKSNETEIVFPLEVPVPITVIQNPKRFRLILHNVTAQTDTIRLDDDPVIQMLNWQQTHPRQVTYDFFLKSEQQWGYELKYEGSRLILILRHPPKTTGKNLQGKTILIDPGHGGNELGARGPNGIPEKTINLIVSQLLAEELRQDGAVVYLTREQDQAVSLQERAALIQQLKPTIALSIHYNALPDSGDPIKTKGVSTFWYHPQAHNLAIFLQNYLVKNLKRDSAGVFWNNLALTRPHAAPSVLLELGFMINPEEFEWITDAQEQKKLASTLAEGIKAWFERIKS